MVLKAQKCSIRMRLARESAQKLVTRESCRAGARQQPPHARESVFRLFFARTPVIATKLEYSLLGGSVTKV